MHRLYELHIADLGAHLLEVCATGQDRNLVHLLYAFVAAAERCAQRVGDILRQLTWHLDDGARRCAILVELSSIELRRRGKSECGAVMLDWRHSTHRASGGEEWDVNHLIRTNAERAVACRDGVNRRTSSVNFDVNLLRIKHTSLYDIAKAVSQEQDKGVAVKQKA